MGATADMSADPLQPGDPRTLGPYELIGRLGAGGQGAVFLGRGPSQDLVAIKLLRADLAEDTDARGRFVREAMAARQVARFCAAQVLDADVAGDRPYIVSEYVQGPSLLRLVRERGPISGAALERLAIGTATALVAIHQAGIVHRDLKPANVLVAPDGPRVIDFGIAKALSGTSTVSSQIIGTPAYMAPEQLRGDSLTPAVDVFAWAATMVFVGTGLPPFGADAIPNVVHRILSEDPDLGDMSGSVRALVADCLAKDPERRPSARQVLLRLLAEEDVVASPAPETAADVDSDVLAQAATLAASQLPFTTWPGAPETTPVPPHGTEVPLGRTRPMAGHGPAAGHQAASHEAPGHGVAGHGPAGPGSESPGSERQSPAEHWAQAFPEQQLQARTVQAGTLRAHRGGLRRRAAVACAGGLVAAAAVISLVLAANADRWKDRGDGATTTSSTPDQRAEIPSLNQNGVPAGIDSGSPEPAPTGTRTPAESTAEPWPTHRPTYTHRPTHTPSWTPTPTPSWPTSHSPSAPSEMSDGSGGGHDAGDSCEDGGCAPDMADD
jgi:hypothetical protein